MNIIERTPRSVTVKMSAAKFRRLQHLDATYRIANAIVRGMKQCENAPAMTVDEAMEFIK